MNFKKWLGIGSFALLSSCAPPQKLPDFPEMSFEEKISYHTQDNELSYFEAKDLVNAYDKEMKGETTSEGEKVSLSDLNRKLRNELCKEYLLLEDKDYLGMYDVKEEIPEKHNELMKTLILCFDQVNTNVRTKEILSKLKSKEKYTLEDALFVHNSTKNNTQVFYFKDGKISTEGVKKFNGLYNSLNVYCSDVIDNFVGYETPYVSMGLVATVVRSLGTDPENSSKVLEYTLEEIIGKKIIVPQKETIYPKTYFGAWWGLLIGLAAPMMMKSLVMMYTKRKERCALDDNIGFMNHILGNTGIDFIHPYVFWGRLFLPVLTEIMINKIKKEK